jgi:hypothetical protein
MILVDGIAEYEAPGLRYKRWSHMVSDASAEELHAFAARLGLRREWSQERPAHAAHHYDVVPTKRALAVKLGAVEVSGRELVTRNYDGNFRRRGCRWALCCARVLWTSEPCCAEPRLAP